tara:strand:+ start:155971 stop:156936 length:966 start_codon:yes stop_codon:yes gene_type:complete
MTRRGLKYLSTLGLVALTACATTPEPRQPPTISPRPQERVQETVPQTAAPLFDEKSAALRRYYQRIENNYVVRGMLRTDGGGPDTPFTDEMLARNFVRIALFDEYVVEGDSLRARATESRLRRWEQPIRMSVEFGASVPAAQQATDTADVTAYASRLSRLTGVPITMTDRDPNYYVLFLDETDRRAAEGRLRQMVPGISPSSLRAILDLPRNQLCIVVAFSQPGQSEYIKAIAVIRAEHPPLLRKSCIHEELAQGMGLANDSPAARPSIFNDDEEFGLLTAQDELLLRMLYDRRLSSSMTTQEAAPIAATIATELTTAGAS